MKKAPPHLVYTRRPNGDALWLPSSSITARLKISQGADLTAAQFNDEALQDLLHRRQNVAKGEPAPLE